ncbi:MAG TPA: hypothetical protein PKZ15_09170, partial [Paludibacteraceae bacterium]|nr:hypothetical protein [Paludibacteraceae bacterium]
MQLFTIIEFFFFIFIAYKILKERSQEKTFYIYVYCCLVLYPATHLISGIPHPTVVLPIMCVIRAWMDGRIKEEWKEFPLKTLLAIMVVYHFFHPLLASLMSYSESLKLELFELSQTFIVLFGGYLLAPVVFDEDKLKRHIYIISVIIF